MVALTPRPQLLLLSLGLGLRVPLWPILARGGRNVCGRKLQGYGGLTAARLEAVCGRKPQQDTKGQAPAAVRAGRCSSASGCGKYQHHGGPPREWRLCASESLGIGAYQGAGACCCCWGRPLILCTIRITPSCSYATTVLRRLFPGSLHRRSMQSP